MSRRRRTEPVTEEEPDTSAQEEADETFSFSFSEEPLTAAQCAEKFASISSNEQFHELVPSGDAVRFLNKVLIGREKEKMQCFSCTKLFGSGTGFVNHISKCGVVPVDFVSQYRDRPSLWLKVDKKSQKTVLEQIVSGDYKCFALGCTKKCNTAKALIDHLDKCIKPAYHTYADRPEEFRKLDTKTKNVHIREALSVSLNGVACLFCGIGYEHQNALSYHIDRCGLDKSQKPWKCYRCGYEGTGAESEQHLKQCAKEAEEKKYSEMMKQGMQQNQTDTDDGPPNAKRRSGIRATARKDGSMLFRYRKSTVLREANGIVSEIDQQNYERACSFLYANWKTESAAIPFCERLLKIEKSTWETTALPSSDPLYKIFDRLSVTIVSESKKKLHKEVPNGIRISSRKSAVIGEGDSKMTAAFCGAPINSIKVAPGQMENGDDVICVTTFANETDFESDSSVVQFWRHRVSQNKSSELELWFLLHLPEKGTVLSMTWLQKHETTETGLIGFAAFSTSIGEVLIYRIDSSSVVTSGEDVQVVVAEPSIILRMPKKTNSADEESQQSEVPKVEGEDEETVAVVKIDESTVPIIKITWAAKNGGRTLVGLTAMGTLVVWDLNDNIENPTIKTDDEWQSPPSDVAFLDDQHIAVGFREKLVKVYNIDDWEVKLEENTMKTAGSRVHTDPRIVQSFFTFQSEYMSSPYLNSTSVAFIDMEIDSRMLIIVPTGNMHQLMVWDTAICPTTGALVSCGIDGRLVASASGRLLKNEDLAFFANRNVLTLKRRKVKKEEMSLPELLKKVKNESEPSSSKDGKKGPIEESVILHEDVCKNMWLEVAVDEPFEGGRPELACRDQRIESLNCVDTNVDGKCPVSFTGGEAGLLFAVPCQLTIEN